MGRLTRLATIPKRRYSRSRVRSEYSYVKVEMIAYLVGLHDDRAEDDDGSHEPASARFSIGTID